MSDFDFERDHVGPGWQPIIEKLHAEMLKLDPNYTIDQIKQKFGGLRYYFHTDLTNQEIHEQLNKLVEEAEKEAERTCEWCGKPGENHADNGWWTTLCTECRETRNRLKTKQ